MSLENKTGDVCEDEQPVLIKIYREGRHLCNCPTQS